jgi:threonine synthase
MDSMVTFRSTRGVGVGVTAPQAVMAGIAEDGGLYVPSHVPAMPYGAWADAFAPAATRIFIDLLPGFEGISALVEAAYLGRFDSPEVAPVLKVGDAFVTELYHGPTAAFKDIALCALPGLMAQARAVLAPELRILVLTATSGDTGSAALAGFAGVEGIRVIVFYPDQGVSAVQKAQMVSMPGANLDVCAIRGNFDDAQRAVKDVFGQVDPSQAFPGQRISFSSANSINIGRLVPQIIYYYTSYASLVRQGAIQPGDQVNFIVPTGNFGDILAGFMARMAGLPVAELICASNENDVLRVFFESGVYDRRRRLVKTLSPSMDILVSSNLERLLWYAADGDAAYVRALMADLQKKGYYVLHEKARRAIAEVFTGISCTDEDALDVIRRVYREHGYLMDPHTATAWCAMERRRAAKHNGCPDIVLATASPFKFPGAIAQALHLPVAADDADAVERLVEALGVTPPVSLTGLSRRPVLHRDIIDPAQIGDYVVAKAGDAAW